MDAPNVPQVKTDSNIPNIPLWLYY